MRRRSILRTSLENPHPLEGIPRRLWRLVSLARHRLLMLDYDGTLAPFCVARDVAVPLPRSLDALRAIAGESHTAVAVVSGRPLAEMERLLGTLTAAFIGEHGWETRLPDGSVMRHPVSGAQRMILDRAEQAAREKGLATRLERKRTGLVVHTRGMAESAARALEDQTLASWQPVAAGGSISLARMDGGVELRLSGRNKGTAVRSLVSRAPAGTLAVFVGDDVTDEDAFEVVREWGFGVRVGPDDRPTLATGRLPGCASVAVFLEEWLRVARGVASAAAD